MIKRFHGKVPPAVTCSIKSGKKLKLLDQIKTVNQDSTAVIIIIIYFLSSLQVSLPLFELLVTKSNTLQCHLVSTISALSTFLDTLQSLADNASNSKGKIN